MLAISASLLGFVVSLLIMFAVIRGAVLSALPKHSDELKAEIRNRQAPTTTAQRVVDAG